MFDTDIKIMDLNGKREMASGEPGEIWARGPQIMQGYLNRPFETNETLKRGWLRTGDIGCLDEDGFLFIVDRKKDMLIYKGYNVYPRELEEILYQHPAVDQCAVIGVPMEGAGEIPKAFVVLKDPGLSEADIIEFVNSRVAAYKKIRAIAFVSALPMSGSGKILKRSLLDNEKQHEGLSYHENASKLEE